MSDNTGSGGEASSSGPAFVNASAQDGAQPPNEAAAWVLAHGLADLLLLDRLRFLQGAMEADPDGTVLAVMRRLVLRAPEAETGAGSAKPDRS